MGEFISTINPAKDIRQGDKVSVTPLGEITAEGGYVEPSGTIGTLNSRYGDRIANNRTYYGA
jgi:hypothetical protein